MPCFLLLLSFCLFEAISASYSFLCRKPWVWADCDLPSFKTDREPGDRDGGFCGGILLLRSTIRRTHTIRVVSNQARGFHDVPRVSIVMPCDFRVWAPFCCGWRTWPRSPTTSLDMVQPSRNHPRRENTDRTHLPNL